jgi:hypothetical protein
MTREDVIRRIVERDMRQLGLSEETVQQEAAELYEAGCEWFGTWETALQYAGIEKRRNRQRRPRTGARSRPDEPRDYADSESVLHEIYRLCLNGYSLTPAKNASRDRLLYAAAARFFGSWGQALEAAGVDVRYSQLRDKRRKLNREDVIQKLQQRYSAGESMVWNQVCAENRELATAAKYAFGSWIRALRVANLDDALPRSAGRLKWNRQQIIEAIWRRQSEGKSNHYRRVRKEEPRIISAARRVFGSWSNAVNAAGAKSVEEPPPCDA